jgi:2-methylcitrate dehydratase
MDATTRRLVDATLAARFEALPPDVVEACKTRLLDSLACIAAAYRHPLSIAARDLATRYRTESGSTVLGTGIRVAPEMAAFANGVMLRVLDLSDMYRTKSGGHPSDVIAAVLAAAEMGARDGRSLIAAIALAYEAYCSGCDAIDFNAKGWDQPVYGVMAAALGAGKLMGLDRARLGHALSLALVPNMAMYQTRQGELSSWKGCAGANASRNALFATLLSQAGFTGPEAVIEGEHGLWDAVGRFEWPAMAQACRRILQTHIKCFPICYHGQSAVWATLQIRDRVAMERIEEIRIDTYRTALNLMAGAPSRWSPATAETADHSLPYVVARALLDGKIDEEAFTPEALKEPRVRELMGRTQVFEDPAFSSRYPTYAPARVAVRCTGGSRFCGEVESPKGHASSPMTGEEIESKANALLQHSLARGHAQSLIGIVRRLERLDDVAELVDAFSPLPEASR